MLLLNVIVVYRYSIINRYLRDIKMLLLNVIIVYVIVLLIGI